MNDFKDILAVQLPSEFAIVEKENYFIIRDRNIDSGKGFIISLSHGPRYFEGKIEFESYARQLADYAELQLTKESVVMQHLNERFPAFIGRVLRQTTEELLKPNTRKANSWWLELDFKVGMDLKKDLLDFTDLLMCYILILFPYKVEGQKEGDKTDKLTTEYERNRLNRALCLAFHGHNCKACGVNMRKAYSGLRTDLIHVHHLNPVATTGATRPDPINDMIPLCPNCHHVAHMRNPPYTVLEIKEMIDRDNG